MSDLTDIGKLAGGDVLRSFLEVAHNDDGTLGAASSFQVGTNFDLDTADPGDWLYVSASFVAPGAGSSHPAVINAQGIARGVSPAGPTERLHAFSSWISDAGSVANKNVSGAINNGAGLIRLTVAAHGYATGDSIGVYGVTGTVEANGQWIVTAIDANTVDLQGSAFVNAYISGGTTTNRAAYYGFMATVQPTVDRGNLVGTAANGDDVDGFVAFNAGTGKATDAIYIGHNSGFAGSEWATGLTIRGNVDYGIALNGEIASWGIDMASMTGAGGVLRIPNNKAIQGVNAAGTADQPLIEINTSNEVVVGGANGNVVIGATGQALRFADPVNIQVGTSTGTRIGTSATQKISFYGVTPIVQPTSAGDVHTVVAGGTTSVFTNTTFDGSSGTHAYTIGDIVKALKSLGLLAA